MTHDAEDKQGSPAEQHTPKEPEKFQFSLRWLLLLITFCAVLFSCSGLLLDVTSTRTIARRTVVDLMGLEGAIEQYKLLYGEYPPSDSQQFAAHLKRLFPRMDPTEPIPDLDEAEALVFWLRGYSPDPRHPLTGFSRTPLFDFDKTRLTDVDGDGWLEYCSPSRGKVKAPFVYFARPYEGESYAQPTVKGIARPKVDVSKGYQILSAGPDGDFGDVGTRRQRAARDNISTVDDPTD